YNPGWTEGDKNLLRTWEALLWKLCLWRHEEKKAQTIGAWNETAAAVALALWMLQRWKEAKCSRDLPVFCCCG
ncbi:hypothetical protein ACQP3J_31200, partial [Escherichia coli]